MKILIAADMEGISGVVHWSQVDPEHKEYARFRRLMTAEVNAGIRGAFGEGAVEVVVADGHGSFRNLLIEELDPRAKLNTGSPAPLAMLQGLDATVAGAMFIGYHARVGTQNAILDHTWSSSCVANLWVNGQVTGEIGVNAALCGHFGVPVILVSGDQAACTEASELLGAVEVVVVKTASGRMTAECLAPEAAQKEIESAARRALRRLRGGTAPPVLRPETPVTVTLELMTSEMGDRAVLLPGVQRLDAKRIQFTADDLPGAYRGLRAAVTLARG